MVSMPVRITIEHRQGKQYGRRTGLLRITGRKRAKESWLLAASLAN